MIKTEDKDVIAMDVLKDIALNIGGVLAERQRAIDALTLFREKALPVLEYIAKKSTDSSNLKERASIYIKNIKSGIKVHMGV
jgi:hypothetical protein